MHRCLGRIDPDRLGKPFEPRRAVDEALGPLEVGGHADAVPLGEDLVGSAVVDDRRCQVGQGGMVMLVVVPGEEHPMHLAGMLGRVEAAGEAGPVLEGFELGFREGVVVGDPRT